MRLALLAIRLLLAAVFLYAAWTKLSQPWTLFALSIDAYGLLPEWAVLFVARTLPWAELGLGFWLASGFWTVGAAMAASAVLALFFGVMLYSFTKGMGIDCGCFGVGEALSAKTLARDGAILGAALALVVMAKCRKARGIKTAA